MMTHKISAYERTLNTADSLFYAKGIHAVGVDQIVAHAKIAKSTLYEHFGSKAGLITAYLQRRTERTRDYFTNELAGIEGIENQLERIFSLMARACARHEYRGCPFINFASEFPDRSHPAWDVCLDHRQWMYTLFECMGRAEGLRDSGRLAEQLMMQYDAIMVGAVFAPGAPIAETALRSARQMIDGAR